MNKKGAEKFLSVYWFVILVIVAGGIWAMVNAYYSHPIDVRATEVRVLTNKAADCISKNGNFNSELFNSTGDFQSERFLEVCHFTEDFGFKSQENDYYLEINFFDVGGQEKSEFGSVQEGFGPIKENCETFQEGGEVFPTQPTCLSRGLYVVNSGEQILVEIFGGVNKGLENVKV